MKTLEASQDALVLSSALQLVTLVKLTTYSDRAALTVNQVRYLSNGARLYKWAAGAVQQFDPWVIAFSGAKETMNHIPSSDGSGLSSTLLRTRQLMLRNTLPEFPGSFIYKTLRAENLELARVEIAQLFLNPGQSFIDLSNLSGSEMTWVFRGQVAKVHDITSTQFVLDLESELPRIPWIYVNSATADPRDVGKRVPIALGHAKRVPAVGWTVGAVSTLAVAISKTNTTVSLTDASRFATSGSGTLGGSETISWSGKSGNNLTGVTRGAGISAVSHRLSESMVEAVTTAAWIASGIAASAIPAVYVRSPFNGAVVLVPSSRYSATLADTTTISGQTVASIKIAQANLLGLMNDLARAITDAGTSATTVNSDTRSASALASPGPGKSDNIRDGQLLTQDTPGATRRELSFPAVAGRTITRVRFRVHATLNNGNTLEWYSASSGGSALATITNDFGVTRTDWWEVESTNATLCGATIWLRCASGTIQSVQRIEFFTGGPLVTREERMPDAYAGSGGGFTLGHMGDSILDAGAWTFGTAATNVWSQDFTWNAVAGRTIKACIYRVYASVPTACSLGLAKGGAATTICQAQNDTGATITDWFEFYSEDASVLGATARLNAFGVISIFEIHRVELYIAATSTDPTVAAATVGLGLEFFCDVDGPKASGTSVTYGAGYPFDEGTGWSVSQCTQTNDTTTKTEGASSQKLVATGGGGTSYATKFALDSDSANWSSSNAVDLDESVITTGGGSLKGVGIVGGGGGSNVQRTFAAENWTGYLLRLWVYFPDSTGDNKFQVLLSGGSGFIYWNIASGAFTVGSWTQLDLDMAAPTGQLNFDASSVTQVIFAWNFNVPVNSKTVYIDEFELGTPSAPTVMQLNATAATVNLTTIGAAYRVSIRGDSMTAGATVRLFFSNTAGSGTIKPASYWQMDIPTNSLTNGAFVTIDGTVVGIGSPATPNNVETVGVELLGTGGTVWIDDLRVVTSSGSPYVVANGTLLECMPDLIHYVIAILCGLGHTVIDASFATAGDGSHLNANVHACDLSALGATDLDILNAMAFESRGNLLHSEGAAATLYRFLVATSAYSWGSAAATLTQWESLLDEGRDTVSVATRFRWLYAWHPELGDGIAAYSATRIATVSAAETKFGRRDARPQAFRTIQAAATMNEVGGYYEQELSSARMLRRIPGSPWPQGWKLERGDIVSITAQWDSAALKARVIETTLRADQKTDLRVVEVP